MNMLFPSSSKAKCTYPVLHCCCCFYLIIQGSPLSTSPYFWSKKYIVFSTIRNCIYKRDMEFRPFYLIVRHFVCNLKIPLINSVITPFKVLIISIADWRMFWWCIETKPCNKSIFIKYLSITARPYQWVQLNYDLKKCIH